MLGLYIHIPFCSSICNYCNFNRGLFEPGLKDRYVSALIREIRTSPFAGAAADTIFFGGGTPSLLDPPEIARIIEACRDAFEVAADAEITLETNPETSTGPRMGDFREARVNRVSFGVQSFRDEELRRLGRIHSAGRARDAVAEARAAGFDNISLDLMMWLPQQTPAEWRESVESLIDVGPEHASLYLLELYPNAPLKEDMARAGRLSAVRDLERCEIGPGIAAQSEVLAGRRVDRLRMRSALHARGCPLEKRVRDRRLHRSDRGGTVCHHRSP
jgi:oxygen-independent coproporphyrinogen-3 oxidase